MTTKQMKELYETGAWIAVFSLELGCYDKWSNAKNPDFETEYVKEWKLIHKKHKHILEHVLSGGEVAWRYCETDTCIFRDFINNYKPDLDYEIIPKKQSFNGHYCIATKLHYGQLVKDGHYYTTNEFPLERYDYIIINGNKITLCDKEYRKLRSYKPMHYHNGQWVFGSLEHDEEGEDICGEGICYCNNFECEEDSKYGRGALFDKLIGESAICCAKCGAETSECVCPKPPKQDGSLEHEEETWFDKVADSVALDSIQDPKQPKRITREEALRSMEVFIGDAFQQRKEINYRWFIPAIFDYIEYLEANQKEK